jgi:hypothetical protein
MINLLRSTSFWSIHYYWRWFGFLIVFALRMHRLPPWGATGMSAVRALPSAIAATIALFGFADRSAFARGSQAAHDDPANSERIERLPPEVRDAVIHMCGDPRAGHYFATYFDNAHLIRLHFEQLYCDGRRKFCRGEDCLHNEYISTGGRYRLIRSYYGRNND